MKLSPQRSRVYTSEQQLGCLNVSRRVMASDSDSIHQVMELFLLWLKRDLSLRYASSILGLIWLLLQPLTTIAIFTLVFHVFFHVQWSEGDGSTSNYVLNLFVGLSLYNFLAEVLQRSPTLITSHAYLVTKVRFPLLLLGAVSVGSATLQLTTALLLLMPFVLAQAWSWQTFLLPLMLMPLVVTALGLAWWLSALGIYLRDLVSAMPLLTNLLMFLSPVMYPAKMVPPSLAWLFGLNPLAWAIEATRSLLLHGHPPLAGPWCIQIAFSLVWASMGLAFFQRVRSGFVDVL